MNRESLAYLAQAHLDTLCGSYPDRHVGGPGNHAAVEYFRRIAMKHGMTVREKEFDCIEWKGGEASIETAAAKIPARVSPYALPCDVDAELVAVSTIDALEACECREKVLLIHGELAKEQLMPKNFVFYNPDSHKRVYAALEAKAPAAVIAATGKNPDLAGSMYPFPLIEDGDFDIPAVHIKDVEGEELLTQLGTKVRLLSKSERLPAKGSHLEAAKSGTTQDRLVVFAHIDSKHGTPGALDNGTGVVVLLLLAALLEDYTGGPRIELYPLNGEDDYAAPGQMMFVKENRDRYDSISLCINLDGAGCFNESVAVTTYNLPKEWQKLISSDIASREGFVIGEAWYQGDHGILLQQQRPVIAVTSENFAWLCQEITHTTKDSVNMVDPDILADIALFLKDVIGKIAGMQQMTSKTINNYEHATGN